MPKKWKEGDTSAAAGQEQQHVEADVPNSPTSLSDITQGEAAIFDENGNLYEEPQVPPPVKRRQPQDMLHAH